MAFSEACGQGFSPDALVSSSPSLVNDFGQFDSKQKKSHFSSVKLNS